MPDLRKTRRKVKTALVVMGAVDVIALIVYFSPLVSSELSRRTHLDELWRELQLKTREVQPLRGLDKKIPIAQKQIDQFYNDRFPSKDSVISEALGKLASETGVKIANIKYSVKDPEPVGVSPVEIEADMSGDYLQLVRFINALERSQTFFLVDSVSLAGEQGGLVKLQVKMETYLKTGKA
jgi:Tfp pilus assembly protein PilO